jgi:predicted transcriptional regulator
MTKRIESSTTIDLHIGTPEDMGRRFIDAWHRAERGEEVNEEHITFRNLEALLAALTPKRVELLRHVRHNRVPSVKALATDLHRDYKNVHQDVEELTKIGLLARNAGEVTAPFGEVEAKLVL